MHSEAKKQGGATIRAGVIIGTSTVIIITTKTLHSLKQITLGQKRRRYHKKSIICGMILETLKTTLNYSSCQISTFRYWHLEQSYVELYEHENSQSSVSLNVKYTDMLAFSTHPIIITKLFVLQITALATFHVQNPAFCLQWFQI